MTKTGITLTIDEAVLHAVKVRAARLGVDQNQLIEDTLRQRLGRDLFEWASARSHLDEVQATTLAVEAQSARRLSESDRPDA